MTVYVDDVRHKFGNMVMCHLWADTDEELLAMVDKIGVQRKWIQGHLTLSFGKHRNASWVHFDIALSKKALAIEAGAVLTDKYGPVMHTKRLEVAWGLANNRPDVVDRANAMIITIEEMRTGRQRRGCGSFGGGSMTFNLNQFLKVPEIITSAKGEPSSPVSGKIFTSILWFGKETRSYSQRASWAEVLSAVVKVRFIFCNSLMLRIGISYASNWPFASDPRRTPPQPNVVVEPVQRPALSGLLEHSVHLQHDDADADEFREGEFTQSYDKHNRHCLLLSRKGGNDQIVGNLNVRSKQSPELGRAGNRVSEGFQANDASKVKVSTNEPSNNEYSDQRKICNNLPATMEVVTHD